MIIKYPKTYHLPWSKTVTKDDRYCKDVNFFNNKEIIITEKMDGENTSLYNNYFHARSLDSKTHISQHWCKNFHSQIKHHIPIGWRVCGENMWAKHSIAYDNLDSFFYGFSIWNENNVCLKWDDTVEWFELLGITTVPVLYSGTFDIEKAKKIFNQLDINKQEGYVIRIKDCFKYTDFKKSVAKCVRENHVQTTQHWKHGYIVSNKLKGDLK